MIAGGLCALAALAARPLAAQSMWGLRAGINFANVSGDDVGEDDFGTKTGLLAGAFVEFPIAEIVNVHLGANYSQKGFEADLPNVDDDPNVEIDYIEVPALITVLVPGTDNTDIRLYVGPTFAWLVHCEGEAFGFEAGCDDDNEIEDFDVGGEVGVGVSVGMGSGAALLVDGFYNFGVKSIDASADDADVKNEVFSISAGVMFPLD
jgi:hypothetical protein